MAGFSLEHPRPALAEGRDGRSAGKTLEQQAAEIEAERLRARGDADGAAGGAMPSPGLPATAALPPSLVSELWGGPTPAPSPPSASVLPPPASVLPPPSGLHRAPGRPPNSPSLAAGLPPPVSLAAAASSAAAPAYDPWATPPSAQPRDPWAAAGGSGGTGSPFASSLFSGGGGTWGGFGGAAGAGGWGAGFGGAAGGAPAKKEDDEREG